MEQLFEAFDPSLLDKPVLPVPPDDLAQGEAVVIARWVGPRWGALLCVINPDQDEDEPEVHLDAAGFRRVPGGWEESLSSGGTDWWTTESPLFRRREMYPRAWALHHFHEGPDYGWHAPWAIGVAGVEAAWVEVTDVDGAVRRPLEAPLGSFVVAWNGSGPVAVEVVDEAGDSLGKVELPGVP